MEKGSIMVKQRAVNIFMRQIKPFVTITMHFPNAGISHRRILQVYRQDCSCTQKLIIVHDCASIREFTSSQRASIGNVSSKAINLSRVSLLFFDII